MIKTNAILLSIIIGISQGSQPIVGFNYGAKQYARTWYLQAGHQLQSGGIRHRICAVSGVPAQIISIFGTGDVLYFEFAVRFMRIFLFMVLVNGVQLISSNFFAAIGKPIKGVILSLTRQVFFLVPLLLILPLFMGIDGILFAGPIADGVAFVTTTILIRREMNHIRQLEQQATQGNS